MRKRDTYAAFPIVTLAVRRAPTRVTSTGTGDSGGVAGVGDTVARAVGKEEARVTSTVIARRADGRWSRVGATVWCTYVNFRSIDSHVLWPGVRSAAVLSAGVWSAGVRRAGIP